MAEVFALGTFRRALGFTESNLSVQYDIVTGEGWTVEDGKMSLQSQFDTPDNPVYDGHVFIFPFEVHLKTMTLSNQPGVKVQLFTLDKKNLKQLVGQTEFQIPLKAGKYILKLPCWKVSRSYIESGGRAAPGGSIIIGAERAAVLTESAGFVEVDLYVATAGLQERGILV